MFMCPNLKCTSTVCTIKLQNCVCNLCHCHINQSMMEECNVYVILFTTYTLICFPEFVKKHCSWELLHTNQIYYKFENLYFSCFECAYRKCVRFFLYACIFLYFFLLFMFDWKHMKYKSGVIHCKSCLFQSFIVFFCID